MGGAFGVITFVLVVVLNRSYAELRTNAVAVAAMGLGLLAGLLLAVAGRDANLLRLKDARLGSGTQSVTSPEIEKRPRAVAGAS